MRARGVLAAALLLGAAARLALPPDAASAAEGRRSGAGTEPLRGVIARSELCLPLPEGELAALLPLGERVRAGGAFMAAADGAEGLAQALRDCASGGGAAGRLAYESAALAASLGAPELAGPLAALYSEGGGGSYTLLRAPESALWFGFADGFEGLTARYLASLTARELGGLLDAGEAKAREAPGEAEEREGAARLVLSERWYFAALCPEGAPLSPGGEARLDFGGFSVRAAVESVGEAQDGEKPVLFSCGERVAFTAQLRFAAARLAAADDPR